MRYELEHDADLSVLVTLTDQLNAVIWAWRIFGRPDFRETTEAAEAISDWVVNNLKRVE